MTTGLEDGGGGGSNVDGVFTALTMDSICVLLLVEQATVLPWG